MKLISEDQYDFKKVQLKNGLANGYNKSSNRRPVVIAVLFIANLGVGWAVIS